MHEGHFTENIVNAIIDELKKYPQHKPKCVKVKVGEIHHLEASSVQMHFKVLTKGTFLEDAELELEEEKISIFCRKCHQIGSVADHHFMMCLACNSTEVTVRAGNQITIETIELVKDGYSTGQ